MLQKRLMLVLGLVIALSMVLTACGSAATPAPTAAPAAQATATVAPARHGGYLDEIDASVVSSDSAVTQLQAGAIDVFSYGLPSSNLAAIKSAGLSYGSNTGLYYDILYNPAVFTDKSVLNPFSDRKIREATNYLYDRNYINQEIFSGGGLVKYFPFMTDGPDYTDLADVAASLEAQYAYNVNQAKQTITTEMTSLGATQDASGKWQYKGKPVTLTFIIRNDDTVRKPLGDYVTAQLESVGFTVNELYKKSSEASPYWIRSNPTDGTWSLYTAAWINTAIERDGKTDFQSMYLPDSVQGIGVFAANAPDPAFQKVGDDLANGNFTTLDQRHQMMAQAMKLGLQDSLQVWLIDAEQYVPYSSKVQATVDLGAGLETASTWPFTTRFKDQVGGTLKWGTNDMFTDPWNPVAGSNWTWDQGLVRATNGSAVVYDPFTGLGWPLRIQKMDMTVQTGLPVFKTLDWVTLSTADKITPPSDAWVDWDAKSQTFITVADAANAAANIAKVQTQAATLAGAVDLKTMVAPPAVAPSPAANATPVPPTLDAGGQALAKVATDLGTFYTQTTGKSVDVAGALTSSDNVTAIETEVAKVAGITTGAADQQKEIASWAVGFVGGLDGSGYYTLGTTDFTTAKTKEVVTYPADMFQTVKWHDGSPLSVGDFVMNIIETFDRAKPDSPVYDDTYVPLFQSFQSTFKGVKIDSTNPLVIEFYNDAYTQDAELNVPGLAWPSYCTNGCTYGEAPWEIVAASNQAEANGQLVYTSDKAAEKKGVEQTNYVGGPSLDILTKDLATLASNSTIPYAPTMGKYVTADEAKTRYANMQAWYTAHKTYWVGTGPYYLDSVNLTGKTLTLKNFADYPDLADRWTQFSTPMLATVKLDGPAQVKIGDSATFNVTVTFNGNPYPQKDVKQVKYLVFDATGAVVNTGVATAVADGQWQVVLDSATTSKLTSGSNKIQVAVAPIPVAQPAFATLSFVTTP